MNLESIDKLDDKVHEDRWSVKRPKFGVDGQLTVIGWTGHAKAGAKHYIVHCTRCSEDPEMFGEGYFRTVKGSLDRGTLPCGCSPVHRWSQEQWILRIKRKAQEIKMSLISIETSNISSKSLLTLKCESHGEWKTRVNNLLNMGTSCEKCSRDAFSLGQVKPDGVMIASFFASGIFHPDTKFWRSERKTIQGVKAYWFSYCPVCDTQGESVCTSLQQGHSPCQCSRKRQREAYVNLLEINGGVFAVKFGIACNSERRLRQQNNKACGLKLTNFAVYEFPNYATCKLAERLCKRELECSFVNKDMLEDGYTETTSITNLNRVLEIYESCGGVLLI